MFLNTFSPTRSPNPEAGSWVVAPHQGRPFGTAQKRSWFSPPSRRRERALLRLLVHGHRADDEQHIAAAAAADG